MAVSVSTVAEMSAQQAIEFAVRVFLTQGFSATYYSTWREAAEDVGDPIDEDSEWFDFLEESGVWYAFENYTDTSREYLCSGILVKYEGSESSGVAVANESYFVIFSLEDSTGKRYFKRDGFYNSYEGGKLYDYAENLEVHPIQVTVNKWETV